MLTVKEMHDSFESILDMEFDAGKKVEPGGTGENPVGVVINLVRIRELPDDIFTEGTASRIPLMASGYINSSAIGEGPIGDDLAAVMNVQLYNEFSQGHVVATSLGEFFRMVNKLYEFEHNDYDRTSALVYAVSNPVNITDDDDAMIRYMSQASFTPPENHRADASEWEKSSAEIWIPSAVTGEDDGTETLYILHLISIRDVISGVIANHSLSRAFLQMLYDEIDDQRFKDACRATLLHAKLAKNKSGGSYNEQFGIEGIDWTKDGD